MAQLLDGTLEHRMSNVELGLTSLDKKVDLVDRKIDHISSVQISMHQRQEELGRDFRDQLDDQRQQLKLWQKEVKKNMGGRCQFYTMIITIVLWFFFMLNYWWYL